MTKEKKISAKERLEIYEDFFSRLHFLRYIAGNERKVLELMAHSDAVAVARCTHDASGKALDEKQVAANTNAALAAMRDALK